MSAFYSSARPGTYESSELTRGPWDPESQHAGPPAALIGREIERCPGIGSSASDRLVGRITFEILRPVPIAPLAVEAEVARPGRRVDMVVATLREAAGGEELISARAWRVRVSEVELPEGVASREARIARSDVGGRTGGAGPPPLGGIERDEAFFPTGSDAGYHTAIEYRFASGGFRETGPAVCWMRMRQPLVEGEDPSPLQRVLVAADSGNGISAALDFDRFLFINVDLSVHLHRMPSGEWVCLDSLTVPEPTGLGLADTLLLDEEGPIGRAAQTLLVAER